MRDRERARDYDRLQESSPTTMAEQDTGNDINEDIIFLESNIPKDFEGLDQTFRCQICASLFDKAVAIKDCGHTFCSVCIRNYWVAVRTGIHRQKKSCPICRTPVDSMDIEKALVMNRSIQEGVKAYKQILLKHHLSSSCQNEYSPSNRSQRSCRNRKRKSPTTKDYDDFSYGDNTRDTNDDRDESSAILKKMESRNYGRMKKRELQKLCKEQKISASGSEQELIDRLRNYQNRWNAEVLHSINPKKPSDIAAELKKEEEAQLNEKKMAQRSGASSSQEYMRKLNASIKSGNQKITSGNATFDRKIKANFEAMTVELQARMKRRTRSRRNDENDGSLDSTNATTVTTKIKDRALVASSSIEMIDVETSSEVPGESITNSGMDLREAATSLVSSSTSSTSTEKKLSSFTLDQSSMCTANHDETIMTGQRSLVDKRIKVKDRRRSPRSTLGTIRANWGCGRCTYENKGIDYVCQMCGHRKDGF